MKFAVPVVVGITIFVFGMSSISGCANDTSEGTVPWLVEQLESGKLRQGDLLPELPRAVYDHSAEDSDGTSYGFSSYENWDSRTVLLIYWTNTKTTYRKMHTAYRPWGESGVDFGEKTYFYDKELFGKHISFTMEDENGETSTTVPFKPSKKPTPVK